MLRLRFQAAPLELLLDSVRQPRLLVQAPHRDRLVRRAGRPGRVLRDQLAVHLQGKDFQFVPGREDQVKGDRVLLKACVLEPRRVNDRADLHQDFRSDQAVPVRDSRAAHAQAAALGAEFQKRSQGNLSMRVSPLQRAGDR